MMLHTFGQQTFAASLPPARKSGTATLCFHARTKTMLAFARSFRCLIGAFHLLTVNVDGKGRNSGAVVNVGCRGARRGERLFTIRRLTQTPLQRLTLRVYSPKNRQLPVPAFSMINPQ